MAIKFTIEKHHVCFPTKVLSGQVGRTLNMVIKTDTDNGTVVGKGAYVSFDQYETAAAPSTFEGEILEQAADGNWYVEVKKVDVNEPAILIYEVPVIAEQNYDSRFKALSNFFNEASSTRTKTVRGYVLNVTDVYELSEDAFEGTPEKGKKVTINGQKHKVVTE
jgi:hypothetical protein|uniref:Uncharacterized protein n=1 Tax=virus sp. ctmTa7 TaxID=2828255 RepID=A0A8S5RCP8_9VIRU|nr:MAG TPA: hypothetical protein [virus sp. ctmTa7]